MALRSSSSRSIVSRIEVALFAGGAAASGITGDADGAACGSCGLRKSESMELDQSVTIMVNGRLTARCCRFLEQA
jgi:hypothetical protein